MNIKKLTPNDWVKLKKIRLLALESDPQAFGGNFGEEIDRSSEDWRKRLASPNRIYIAGEMEGNPVALAGALLDRDGEWMIVAVYTSPEVRGRGYAQELVKVVIEELRKRGVNSIKLTVNTDQIDAVRIYEKFGFKTYEDLEEEMGDGKLHKAYKMRLTFKEVN